MKMYTRRAFVAAMVVGAAVLSLASHASAVVDVTWCGQTIPAGETGILQHDLHCPPDLVYDALLIEADAQLDLNGHTLSGGTEVVACTGKSRSCVIRGPGVIAGALESGIDAHAKVRRLIIENVTIRDNGAAAVHPNGRPRVRLTNVVLERNNLVVLGSPTVRGRIVEVDGVIALDNGAYVFGGKVRGRNVALDGNRGAISGGKIQIQNASITNSTDIAILRAKVRLEDSTLANNDTAGSGVDLLTKRRPRLTNTTCYRSVVCVQDNTFLSCVPHPQEKSWEVCASDP